MESIKKETILENGNRLIYIKYNDKYGKFEEWEEYDTENNLIHFKDSNGNEFRNEYTEQGKSTYTKNSEGLESWINYNKNDNTIQCKNSSGKEILSKYDEDGNIITTVDEHDISIRIT